ncbi:hypothetical protein GMRT_16397 [Giardia muris]|uniref:Uncharacterized protein n=1 Tax=Giardia muris TaxID=5742 RepID=A0A4Z1SSE1_GIAMU|nr:hypothetical protein GMRT_16397 [Giardia muris]|eukprot:TNJ26578.1 hypothetical protein GMRT_16397 [Giardia muris]
MDLIIVPNAQAPAPPRRERGPYPAVLPELPPRPDYGAMEAARAEVEKELEAKRSELASVLDRLEHFRQLSDALRLETLPTEKRQELRRLLDVQRDLRKRLGEIKENLGELSKGLVIDGRRISAERFEERLEALEYELDHTSMSHSEERERRAELGRLAGQRSKLEKIKALEAEQAEAKKALDEARTALEPLQAEADSLQAALNPDGLSRAQVFEEINRAQAERGELRAAIAELERTRSRIYCEYRAEMHEYTRAERTRKALSDHRAFLRGKWAGIVRDLERLGVVVTEEGDESGVFRVIEESLKPVVREQPQIQTFDPAAAEKMSRDRHRSELLAWCEQALEKGEYGTARLVPHGKKRVVAIDERLIFLLDSLGIPSSSVADEGAVRGLIETLQEKEEEPEQDSPTTEPKVEAEEEPEEPAHTTRAKALLERLRDFKATVVLV